MHIVVALAILTLFTSSSAQAQTPEQSVRQFVAAFNQHDVEAMTQWVTEDVQWHYIQAEQLATETQGKAALSTAMESYFASCSSCKSELIEVSASGNYVTTIEQASWQSQGETQQQRSVAVYQFDDGLIQRVYYFPSHRAPKSKGQP